MDIYRVRELLHLVKNIVCVWSEKIKENVLLGSRLGGLTCHV